MNKVIDLESSNWINSGVTQFWRVPSTQFSSACTCTNTWFIWYISSNKVFASVCTLTFKCTQMGWRKISQDAEKDGARKQIWETKLDILGDKWQGEADSFKVVRLSLLPQARETMTWLYKDKQCKCAFLGNVGQMSTWLIGFWKNNVKLIEFWFNDYQGNQSDRLFVLSSQQITK